MKAVLTLCLLLATAASAAGRDGTTVTIARDEQLREDVYVGAGTAIIEGRIDGDLTVVAGELRLDGEVTGDVFFFGGRGVVTGKVGGSLRGAAGQLTVEGTVEDDLAFVGGDLGLARGGTVGRDLLVAAGRATSHGDIWRHARAWGGRLELDGLVGGDVGGQLGALVLGEGARVFGDVKVATDADIERAPGAQIVGELERTALPGPAQPPIATGLVSWLRSLVAMLAVAALWLMLFPGFSRRAMATLRARPGASLGYGALALVATPVVAALVFALGLALGGWWLSAVALGALLVAAAIAAPLVGHFIGQRVLRLLEREGSEAQRQVIGLVVLTLLAALPFVGGVVIAVTAAAGVGAQLLALKGRMPVRTSERLDALRDTGIAATSPN